MVVRELGGAFLFMLYTERNVSASTHNQALSALPIGVTNRGQVLQYSIARLQDLTPLCAYVLMTNHVHLLLTPKKAALVPRLIMSIGRRYVQYFNVQTH
jgi:hypothetical protein